MRRNALLLAAVLALLAPSAARAGRGERPDLSPIAADQVLAKRLGLHVGDLSRSIRWRRHPNRGSSTTTASDRRTNPGS
jgi:hypothetical protein